MRRLASSAAVLAVMTFALVGCGRAPSAADQSGQLSRQPSRARGPGSGHALESKPQPLDVIASPDGAYVGTLASSVDSRGTEYATYTEHGPGPLVVPLSEGRGSRELAASPEHEHWLFVAVSCTGGGHVALGSGPGRQAFMVVGPCDGTIYTNRYLASSVSLVGGWQLRASSGTIWQMAAVASGNAHSGEQTVRVNSADR